MDPKLQKWAREIDPRGLGSHPVATLGGSAHFFRFWLHFLSILAPLGVTLAPFSNDFECFLVSFFLVGNVFLGLLSHCVLGLFGCWVGALLGCWVVGLLGCWVVGMLGCWDVGLLCCWLVGLLGCWVAATQQKGNQANKDRKNRKDDEDKKDNPTTHNPIDMARRNARSD